MNEKSRNMNDNKISQYKFTRTIENNVNEDMSSIINDNSVSNASKSKSISNVSEINDKLGTH